MKILFAVVPVVVALAAMAIAMVVVTQVFHLDLRAELARIRPASPIDEVLPEA